MEHQIEADTLIEQGNTLLAAGNVKEAAAAFTRAIDLQPRSAQAHLGLAEAELTLGGSSGVYLAARQVQLLAPDTADAALARALLFVVERRYDAALQELDYVVAQDPGRAYAHALRGYCLRQLGRAYDAGLAEAKARRLSSGQDFSSLFPRVDAAVPTPTLPAQVGAPIVLPPVSASDGRRGSPLRRQIVRLRFMTGNVPVVTYTLIAVNVLIYLATALYAHDLLNPSSQLASDPLYRDGVQVGALMRENPLQWYRLVTAMFLHANYLHIGLNMLSLYFLGARFMGVGVERIFGRWRYILLYFATGIIAGLTQYFLTSPLEASLGASGAIFGIFGAYGAFIVIRRSALGRMANPVLFEWIFWVGINFLYAHYNPDVAVYDHLGGLVSGFVLGALLLPRITARRK
ncbi:MAG: hypothetical protein PVSMB4_05630 [Ktedonobacterales bacterium]